MAINLEKYINSEFANELVTKDWYLKIYDFAKDLTRLHIIIILVIALVLLAFMVYRKLGPVSMAALVFFYLIVYILYQFDFLAVYEEREFENSAHMKMIQEEIERE